MPFDGGHVRVDFTSVAAHVPAGGRVALIVGYGELLDEIFTTAYTPDITVRAGARALASHVVIPVAGGSVGGRAPSLSYPPRPFLPALADQP